MNGILKKQTGMGKRAAALVLAAVMAVCLCVPSQAFAYFSKDPVNISLGSSSVTVREGSTTSVRLTIDPMSEEQLPGCGMAICPDACNGLATPGGVVGGCLDENGWCTCGGTKYSTHYTNVSVSSSNTYVASVSYSGGSLKITGRSQGEATIRISATLDNHADASASLDVTVTGSGSVTPDPTPTPDPGTDPTPTPDPSNPSEPGNPDADGTTHTITYVLGGGVNAASNPAEYTEGTAVALAEPTREGYDFDGWFTDAALTQQVSEIAATSAGDVTLYAKWTEAMEIPEFSDVDPDAWYGEAVGNIAARGLIRGNDGTFGVGRTMTRAEFAVIMWRYAQPSAEEGYDEVMASTLSTTGMADVEDGAWYTGAANWAVATGVISGVENADGTRSFNPYGEVTFEQMITILANLTAPEGAVEATDASVLEGFSDASSADGWATQSLAWAYNQGFYSGYDDGSFGPVDDIARERAAAILYNGFENGLL